MTYDTDKVIKIATKLKAAREQVYLLEEQLRQLVMEQSNSNQSSSTKQRRKGQPSEVASKVMDLLKTEPDKDFTVEEIRVSAGVKETYARPLLSKLASDKLIEKRGRGTYGFARQTNLEPLSQH